MTTKSSVRPHGTPCRIGVNIILRWQSAGNVMGARVRSAVPMPNVQPTPAAFMGVIEVEEEEGAPSPEALIVTRMTTQSKRLIWCACARAFHGPTLISKTEHLLSVMHNCCCTTKLCSSYNQKFDRKTMFNFCNQFWTMARSQSWGRVRVTDLSPAPESDPGCWTR